MVVNIKKRKLTICIDFGNLFLQLYTLKSM